MAESLLSQIGDFTLIDSLHSPLNGVIFHNVLPVYCAEESVKCLYSITEAIEPDINDLIGLFKVGWVSSSEVFSSIPAKLPVNRERTFLSTIFEAHQLPSDSSDMYQFCYINKNNVVGASTPFTFETNDMIAVEDPADPGLFVFKSRVTQLKDQLIKLSDEKNYYETKYEVLDNNFSKLKSEFEKLELELKAEKETVKQLEEDNKCFSDELKNIQDNLNKISFESGSDDGIKDPQLNEVRNTSLQGEHEADISSNTEIINEILNSGVWNSLYEIYEVAIEIREVIKSKENKLNMSYEALIDYILDVFKLTKQKYNINGSGQSHEAKHCKCYYEQKAFCCPRWCTDSQFQFMMAQPLYTIFSNYNHFTENGGINCDGSFDPTSLCDYIMNRNEPALIQETVYSEPNHMDSLVISHHETNNIENAKDSSENLNYEVKILQNVTEERDKAILELNLCREKIASLNSRVNVLELELVAQQNNQVDIKKNLNEKQSVRSSSNSSLSIPDFENILESVNAEYINLKDKYKDLCKKSARSNSLELRCAILEQENKKLHNYFIQEWNQQKKLDGRNDQLTDLGNLLIEKEKIESKLISLQKDAVGKISTNLILPIISGQDVRM